MSTIDTKFSDVSMRQIWKYIYKCTLHWSAALQMLKDTIKLQVMHQSAPLLCPPGERQPVSGSQQGAPEAAYSSLQLPGGGGSHQPGHDPRHAGHEPSERRFSTATSVRIINRCWMCVCSLLANFGILACFAVLHQTPESPDPCFRSFRL